jgi:hypothetical protein
LRIEGVDNCGAGISTQATPPLRTATRKVEN